MSKIRLGVVVVTYNSGAEAVDCLETLCAAGHAAGIDLHVVVVDNASADDTTAQIRAWATGEAAYDRADTLPFAHVPPARPIPFATGGADMAPPAPGSVGLLALPVNRGFAGGVNAGLACLAADAGIDDFWVLNPDSVVPPEAVVALACRLGRGTPYALIGGRVTYVEQPDRIQIDGGTIDWRTGVTGNLNLGRSHAATPPPDIGRIDFIMGASLIASRAFYDRAGPMREDYFLYYEEVDWALQRGDLPLDYCAGLRIYHRAGSSIGSPGWGRRASPFSLYFKHRARIMFLRRFRPRALPTGYLYALAIAAREMRAGHRPGAGAVLAGAFGRPAPRPVAERLGPDTARRIAAGTRAA